MAFEEVDVVQNPAPAEKSGVSVGLVKLRSSAAKLRVTIRATAFEGLGFALDDRFVLLVGRDEDHGMIRLRKDKNGKIKPTERSFVGGTFGIQINLGVRPEFINEARKATPVQFEKIDLTTLEIVLPPWADETRPGKTARISGLPPQVAAAAKDREAKLKEEAEAEDRRRQAELNEVAEEAARQTRSAMRGNDRQFRESLKLTRTEAEVLSVLLDRAGQTVTKESIHSIAYGLHDEAPDPRIIDVMVCKIRPKLPVSVSLKTVHGVGYKLTGATGDLLEVSHVQG